MTAESPTWEIVESGPSARHALACALDRAQGHDPLHPVTVVVEGPYAGLALRRHLASAAGRPGLVNVRFAPLPRLAELLGGPAVASSHLSPRTPLLERGAIRAALAQAPTTLGALAGNRRGEVYLARALAELARLPAAARRRLATRYRRGAELVRVLDDVDARTRAYYTTDDLFRHATARLRHDPGAASELGTVVVHTPAALDAIEVELLDALLHASSGHAILALTGDDLADAPARALVDHFTGALGQPVASAPRRHPLTAHRVIDAPEPDDEVRAVVREMLARAHDGTPWHRMAVAYRDVEPYATLLHEQLDGAGIQWSGTTSRRLADTVTGRFVDQILELARGQLRRVDVTAWLACAPVRDPNRALPAPAARWESLARRAAVIAGLDQWSIRLERFRGERVTRLDDAVRADAGEGHLAALRADVEHLDGLTRFMTGLASDLDPPRSGRWEAWSAWLSRLCTRYLGGESTHAGWPDDELDAHVTVLECISNLTALDGLGAPASLDALIDTLRDELAAALPSHGRFGDGVFVGRVGDLAGTDFDTVFVVGMVEGRFPGRTPDDPLLPDALRTGTGLAPRRDQRAAERRRYLDALAAGRERVLTFARVDVRGRREQRPSPWVLETVTALAGERRPAARLGNPDDAWLVRVESFEAALMETTEPGSLQERDLRALNQWARTGRVDTHPLLESEPVVRAGMAAARQRSRRRMTPYLGLVGALPELALALDRPLSATALERYATCPFQYFLQSVLHVEALELPEDADALAPLTRGSLVHDILHEFVASSPRLAPGRRWSAEDRARLREIAGRRFDDAVAGGFAGRPLVAELQRRRLARELDQTLRTDERVRAELGVVPAAVEVTFGPDEELPALEVTVAPGRTIVFRGRIDRVDRSPDGSRLAVWDYKTGRKARFPVGADDRLVGGTRLQLAIYGLAARRAWGGDLPVDVGYWFTTEDASKAVVGYPLDDALEALTPTLDTLTDGIAAGRFPARPGVEQNDTYANCRRCAFDRVCPTDRDRSWSHLRDDPALAPFVELAEPDEGRAP
ncbi:MAG: PD-(D/E)XK nuclease family protein [Acidimicrobiia bacterium]